MTVAACPSGNPSAVSSSMIDELSKLGIEPQIEILKYGLSEAEALLVESTAIELLELQSLCNAVRGHGCRAEGRGLAADIAHQLGARPAKIQHSVVLINIARAYRFGMSPHQLYDATRSAWVVNPERHEAQFALSIYKGIVREVYEIATWVRGGATMRVTDADGRHQDEIGRWEFVGRVANESIRRRYFGRSVTAYFKAGAQNPIMWID
jgi:hypothetical protein